MNIKSIDEYHQVTPDEVGVRVDKIASAVFEHSRANLQKWLQMGNLQLNGNIVKPSHRVRLGEVLTLRVEKTAHSSDEPQNITLDVVYEDEWVLVVNKPAGLVVHPGAGNLSGTLVNGLLYHYPNQALLPRAGLVHRIDKDTTGLLLVAKDDKCQQDLIGRLKDKKIYRHYRCLAYGVPSDFARHKVIDAPIGRHPSARTKMCVRADGKPAITHIKHATAVHANYCVLDVALQTGRTHQIRVHLSHIGHPLLGDPTYGRPPKGLDAAQKEQVARFGRQALHAYRLGFVHPVTAQEVVVEAPLPCDMLALIDVLGNTQGR